MLGKLRFAECTFIAKGDSIPYNENPVRMKEWREAIGATQATLAKEARVSRSLIALIETNRTEFVEPTRTAIWDALDRLMEQKTRRDLEAHKVMVKESEAASILFAAPLNLMRSIGALPPLGATPDDSEAINKVWNQNKMLWQEYERQKAEIERLNEMLNVIQREIDWPKFVEQITAQAATIETMQKDMADMHKLLALRGVEVAVKADADDLQEKIEQRVKGKGDAADLHKPE